MVKQKVGLTSAKFLTRLRYTVFMAATLAAVILITEFLRHEFNFAQHNLVLLYVMSILIISCASPGYIYGLLAAVAGALACDFLIVHPRLEFSFTAGSPVTMVTLLLVTLTTSTMASRLRQQKKLALSQQKHFELLYHINRELLSTRSTGAIADLIKTTLESRLDRPVMFLTRDPGSDTADTFHVIPDTEETAAFLTDEEHEKILTLFQNDAPLPGELSESRRESIYYVPVLTNAGVAGVIGIYVGKWPMCQEECAYVDILARQTALAFEVQHLSDQQEKLFIEAEKEKTRSILLRSISHDFRTPMATIRGASAAIREHPDMSLETREKLLYDIEEYADWIIRTMENILTITKLSAKPLQIGKKEEAAEEVISAAVAIIRKRYPNIKLHIQIPDSVVLVPMNAALIAQVLINLLENAIKNSAPSAGIVIRLTQQDEAANFQIIDNGVGIAPERIGDLFNPKQPFENIKADGAMSKGVGLSICKTIIDAHFGEIEGHNRESGGAMFSFSLPLKA